MCGISGIISRTEITQARIQEINTALLHRGPDAQAVYLNDSKTVALGHTRLSIIDVSVQANQPMQVDNGNLIIVFNGEIYNFKKLKALIEAGNPAIRFVTNSDTEVILYAFKKWGMAMAEHLEGMFAIAIYDKQLDRVFLFRDRVGKKPIYYFCNHEHFIFASEIKALLKHPSVSQSKEIDRQAIHEFLHLGYIPEPKTIYRSIRKFPAGFSGEVWKNLSFSFKPYWKPEALVKPKSNNLSELEIKNTLHNKLRSAVEKRLISDVPLGTFLSGGTDSSLVTALVAEQSKGSVKTFSIGFKESRFDEHRYAAQVASFLKTNHHEYILSEHEAAGLLETYLDHLDEPFADTSVIPTMLVAQMARKEVTVALTGDGGDELFLGYGTYTWASRLANPIFRAAKPGLDIGLRLIGSDRFKRISHLLDSVKPQHQRSHIFSQEQYLFSEYEIRERLLKEPLDYESFRYQDNSQLNELLSEEEKQAFFDLKYYLKDDLLVKVDMASMYHSLECRCPLLDHDIIEFALNTPFSLKRRGGVNKWILKELLKEYLPDSLVNRPKWGFSIPLAEWMKNELNYLMDFISPSKLETTNLFKTDYVSNLITRFKHGEDHLYNRLWAIIVIQRFLNQHA